ncbi:endopeptidase La [Candidatus Microgenomates bacterium]|nr:endopeptidase La [Candidatus Microgenomates bacterium]
MVNLGKKTVKSVPVVALRGSVVFPNTEAVLNFGRPKSKLAVQAAFQGDRLLAVFAQKDARIANPGKNDLYEVGTLVTVQEVMPTEDETHVLAQGVAKVRLIEVEQEEPYLAGEVEEIPVILSSSDRELALVNQIIELFRKAINLGKPLEPTQMVMRIVSGTLTNPVEAVNQIASLLEIRTTEKQMLLEEKDFIKMVEKVHEYLSGEINILELERSIAAKTEKRFQEQMRKAMLRERKRTIEEELGEEEDGDEITELRKKIEAAGMPKDVEDKARKELDRLMQMSPHNPEGGYLRNYLDWLVEMPWSVTSPNNVQIEHASKILDEDHYGLGKAKERILEFLAVMKVKHDRDKTKKQKNKETEKQDGVEVHEPVNPTILCFIGPPGVGKTSIGKSIARALGRKFVRVSLGGIRDEAEIRGHRRTYVGALPGRIIQGIKNAGTKNPVFMLDEIDKIGTDFRGDPSSALLEALDPEQNKEFSDHYLEVPFDLSQVMFICTGNVLDTIPIALRDRLEIIRFPGYTEEEKFSIAKKFLWPKQLEAHGLSNKIEIFPTSLKEIITRYTREAGVRNMERNIATICRKLARRVADRKDVAKQVAVRQIREYLGPERFSSLLAERVNEVGMSTGLAVTATGGEILFVEVALMPGKGKLTLTGQLGDVMQESAKAAFSFARSHWAELGLSPDFARDIDVHIHVPEGAVPKDGPSAGTAITTALVSALTKIPVHREVGMTGEVTLRGRVLEIGGIKEKVIAAHTAGLRTIILPKDNKKDLEEIPDKIKKEIKFVFANVVDDVLKVALTKPLRRKELIEDSPIEPQYLAVS